MKEIAKLGLILTLVATVAAGALSLTYIMCSPEIEAEKEKALKLAIREILPEGKGRAIAVDPAGYSGPIEMLVGIGDDGRVKGVKILKISETPGLGLNADNSRFLSQFKGKTVDDKLKAKFDVQAITGATITTQAVADGVREALEEFRGSR